MRNDELNFGIPVFHSMHLNKTKVRKGRLFCTSSGVSSISNLWFKMLVGGGSAVQNLSVDTDGGRVSCERCSQHLKKAIGRMTIQLQRESATARSVSISGNYLTLPDRFWHRFQIRCDCHAISVR